APAPHVHPPVSTRATDTPAPQEHATPDAGHSDVSRQPDQWMERVIDESGTVRLHGRIMAEFRTGESMAMVHIAFCPVFVCAPEFPCEIMTAPLGRPRPPVVYSYGARIELKRSGDMAQPARTEIRFSAIARVARAA